MTRRLATIIALIILLAPSLAEAHIDLQEPPHRYDRRTQKTGPCGKADGERGDTPTVFTSGETITVRWNEYIDHPGHFRIAFDTAGDDDFVDPDCTDGCDSRSPTIEEYSNDAVLLDGIADKNGGDYAVDVTLPDVTCDNCTLQLIQVMYDKPPYEIPGNDIYYNCADIVLEPAAGGDTGDAADTGAQLDAGESVDAEDDASGNDASSDIGEQDHDTATADTSDTSQDDAEAASSTHDNRAEGGCSTAEATTNLPGVCFLLVLLMGHVFLRRDSDQSE
ncbi:MAG: SCE4755 family polysaccharide monooxygenase-like protein [Myxococcota bacterium]